jgi:hypothetical protein
MVGAVLLIAGAAWAEPAKKPVKPAPIAGGTQAPKEKGKEKEKGHEASKPAEHPSSVQKKRDDSSNAVIQKI